MPDTPLKPDPLEAAAKALRDDHANRTEFYVVPAWEKTPHESKELFRAKANAAVSAYLAAALQEVTSVEELVTTRAGLALANTAFGEGLSAGIRACNASGPDRPFKKPVSPYSAPLLAMIKADRPEMNDA